MGGYLVGERPEKAYITGITENPRALYRLEDLGGLAQFFLPGQ